MGFSRQEYWSGLPFPSPEDLPDPGIKPRSPTFRQTLYHLNHQGSLNKQTNTKINKIPEPVRVRKVNGIGLGSVQFSSVTQSCLTLCNPMDYSMPGLPVHHQLPKLAQNHVHWVGDAILCLLFSFCLQPFPASQSFPMNQLFASGGQSIGVSASASVLPMNIQDWFPLGWTSWISLQSKGFSRAFSNTTVQKHQFFGLQLSL